MADKRERFIRDSNESLQQNLDRGEPVIFASYGIVGAILLLGGIGYLLDNTLDTLPWFFLGGIVVGLCTAFYALLKAARRSEP